MPHYPIPREKLTVGTRIIATANPSIGKGYELIEVHPTGYDKRNGCTRHFIEYDFREVESGGRRNSFTLNYINRYFRLA